MSAADCLPAAPSGDRHVAPLIFAFLLACYLATFAGSIQSSDGLSMFATAESLVREGSADSNQLLWMGLQQGSFGRDGDLFSRKGLGQPLLALPLVWMARAAGTPGLVQAALLLNPLLTALTGAMLYGMARRLGWTVRASTLAAVTFGLATLAWPYTQDFFSEPATGAGMLLALYGLLAFDQSRRPGWLWLAGAGWSAGYLVRPFNLITLPVYALALVTLVTATVAHAPDAGLWLRVRARLRRPQDWLPFVLPIALAALISLWWNWWRFGNPLDSGYLESESFSGDLLAGVYGLLVSPGRGLIWYSPALLLGILGAWRCPPRARWLLIATTALSALYVLLYGKWFMWHGGYAWGPRFLVPLLPLLALWTAPAWQQITQGGAETRLLRVVALLLVGLSLLANGLGLAVPYSLVQDWLASNVHPLFALETFTRLQYSPLIMQAGALRADTVHFAWWRNGPDWLGLVLPLLAAGLGAVWLWRSAHSRPVRSSQAGSLRHTPLSYAFAGAVVVMSLLLAGRYHTPGGDTHAAAERIEASGAPQDGILHLRPEQTQIFADEYHGPLPTYGLPPVAADEATAERQMAWLQARHRRLWVVADVRPEGPLGWEWRLRHDAFLLLDEQPDPDHGQHHALYALSMAGPAPLIPASQVFLAQGEAGAGGLIRLQSYRYLQVSQAGAEVELELHWQAVKKPERNYRVFVHLLDGAQTRVLQLDGEPVLWTRPTSSWQAGEAIVDRYGGLLPEAVRPGPYHFVVGLYDPESGQRLRIQGTEGADAVEISPLEVRAH